MSESNQYYQIKKQVVVEMIAKNSLKKWWVAEFSGVHKTTLRRWLKGRTRFVQNRNVKNLAALLGTSIDQIAEPIKIQRSRGCKSQLLQ